MTCDLCNGTSYVTGEDGRPARCPKCNKGPRRSDIILSRAGIPPRFDKSMPLADALSSLSTSINEQARTNVAKYAESLTVVRSSGQELHSLVFYGKPGSGKTSLATTVFKQIICNGLVDSALWVNSSDLPTMVRATYGTSTSEDDVIDKYKMTDLLLLDDFGRGNITKHAEDLTYRVMDYRYRWDLPLIVTTNDDPRELVEKFDMAVVQRVASTAAWIRMDALKRGIKLEEWEK